MSAPILALPDPLQAPKARVRQCLLLAALTHVLLVLVFGSAPPGSARPGEGAWGRLVVRLEGPAQTGIDSDQPLPDTGPKGGAETRRFGGSVRSAAQAARHEDQAGAAQLGQWRPAESTQPAQATPADTATLASPQAVPSALPQPTVQAPHDIAPPQALAPVAPPTTTLAAPPAPTRLNLPQPLAPATTVPAATQVLQDVPRNTSTLQSQPSAPPRPALPQSVQKLATPAQPEVPLANVAAPTAALAAPQRIVPTALPSPHLQQITTPTSPGMLADVPRPTATLQAPAAASQRAALPAASELKRRDTAPAADTTALRPVETPTARMEAPDTSARTAAEALPQPSELRAMTPSPDRSDEHLDAVMPPAGLAGSAGQGGPDRGSQLGHDVATAPSGKEPPQPLNLKLPMQGPRISSAGGSSGLLPEVPRPPEHEDKLKKDIDKAKREDCRSAYAGGGLLAAIPIAIDTVRDKGCKW